MLMPDSLEAAMYRYDTSDCTGEKLQRGSLCCASGTKCADHDSSPPYLGVPLKPQIRQHDFRATLTRFGELQQLARGI